MFEIYKPRQEIKKPYPIERGALPTKDKQQIIALIYKMPIHSNYNC